MNKLNKTQNSKLNSLPSKSAKIRYLTSLNIKNLGGFIKKGSRGIPIVYSNVICKEHRKRDCDWPQNNLVPKRKQAARSHDGRWTAPRTSRDLV